MSLEAAVARAVVFQQISWGFYSISIQSQVKVSLGKTINPSLPPMCTIGE